MTALPSRAASSTSRQCWRASLDAYSTTPIFRLPFRLETRVHHVRLVRQSARIAKRMPTAAQARRTPSHLAFVMTADDGMAPHCQLGKTMESATSCLLADSFAP